MSILFCHVFFPNIFHSSLAPSAIITQSSLLIVNDFFFNEKMRTFPNELSRFPFYCHLKSFLSKFIVSFLNSLREKKTAISHDYSLLFAYNANILSPSSWNSPCLLNLWSLLSTAGSSQS